MIYSMSREIVDNGKYDIVFRVYRSERYYSSWMGKGRYYLKVYTRRKDCNRAPESYQHTSRHQEWLESVLQFAVYTPLYLNK